MFRASEKFTGHIVEKKGVNPNVKFMPDPEFYRNVKLILSDLFAYKV